jgi:hypothetical protein
MDTPEMEIGQCLDCDMKERGEHLLAGKHQCNRITDPLYPAEWLIGQTLKIGKRKFVKIVEGK